MLPKLNTMKHFVTLAALLTSLVALAQTPQLPFNPDENGDGLIGVADLQSFLALYNTEFSAAVTNNGIALINLGSMNRVKCLTSCNNLPGTWGMASRREISMNWQLFAEAIDWDPDIGGYQNDSDRLWTSTRNTDYPDSEGPNYAIFQQDSDNDWTIDSGTMTERECEVCALCVCSITERPKIEYQRIVQDGSGPTMNTIVNELLNEGWYILSTDELYMHLWRWKD